jgi:hypothetical protein
LTKIGSAHQKSASNHYFQIEHIRPCSTLPKISATVEVLAIAVLIAAMTYFLFEPDAFNTFLEWLFQL